MGKVNIGDLVSQEDLPRAMGGILEILRNRATRRPAEYALRTRDGRRVWVEVAGVRIDEDGMPHSILGIGRDVTDRKLAEQALRESEGRFRSMFDNAAELIYVYDPGGHFLDANERTVSALGYSVTELLTMKLQDVVAEEDVPVALEDLRVIMERGSLADPSEYSLTAKDGRRVRVEVTGVRLAWRGGTSVLLGTARDISSSGS
jgi:PAS domain S-box-containing protein